MITDLLINKMSISNAANKNGIKENSAKFLWQIYRNKQNITKTMDIEAQKIIHDEEKVKNSISEIFHSQEIIFQKTIEPTF